MTPSYLLDTHAAIWLLEGNSKFGPNARAALESEDTIAISDITLLEIAMLARRGIISLRPDPGTAVQRFADSLVVLPITAQIAVEATSIGLPHRDPFDRIITATAMAHGLTLVTKDRQIVDANALNTVW